MKFSLVNSDTLRLSTSSVMSQMLDAYIHTHTYVCRLCSAGHKYVYNEAIQSDTQQINKNYLFHDILCINLSSGEIHCFHLKDVYPKCHEFNNFYLSAVYHIVLLHCQLIYMHVCMHAIYIYISHLSIHK